MKILFMNTNIGYGGANKMIIDIANALSRKHEVDFLTFRDDKGMLSLGERVNHIHNPLYRNNFKPLEIIGQIFKLHDFLKKQQYDVAIAFLHPSHYMLTLAAVGTRTKVLLSERVDPYSRRKNGGLFIHLVEQILFHADGYVFQSDGAMKLYPEKCQKKGVVIVNSIPDDFTNIQYPEKRKKTIVHVARMELIQKRQDVMLKAFKIFSDKHPEYVLEFYGDGPEEEQMKELARELGIYEKVDFKGAQSNIINLISDAGMFVLTSDYEGLPNALLEAAALGLPCISTDCSPGGARMIIEDGTSGFITPCGDYEALAAKMCILAEDSVLAESFSQNAIKVREKYNPSEIYLKWQSFVESVGCYQEENK